MNASPAPTVSTTSTGRGFALTSASPVKAVAPSAPRVSTTSPRAIAAQQAAGDVVGVGVGVEQLGVLVAELDQRAPRARGTGRRARRLLAVVEERLPQVGVVADEHLAGTRLLDEVEHALASRLEQGAQRADVQRPARRQLLARGGSTPGRSRSARPRSRRGGRSRPTYARVEVGTATISASLAVTCCTTSPPRSSWPTWLISVVGTSRRASPTATLSGEPPGVSEVSPSWSTTTSMSASPATTITRRLSARSRRRRTPAASRACARSGSTGSCRCASASPASGSRRRRPCSGRPASARRR